MKTRFVYIIMLLALIFSSAVSRASSPGANKHYSSAHDKLLCLDCHSYIKEDPDHPSVEDSNKSCSDCHETSFRFSPDSRKRVKCLDCHSRHHEAVSNDAHLNVPCQACHLYEIRPVKEIKNGQIKWRYEPETGEEYNPHRLAAKKENICSRCHFKGNNLGVSDQALPAKSIICMPCHAATFSAGDIPSVTAIIIFLIGISGIVLVWLSAGKSHKKSEGPKPVDFISLIEILIFDVLLQRRLLKVSVKRWIIHGMIFFPFAVRFFWGVIALVFSLVYPEWNITWVMLDKISPVTGLVFDITGLMILLGGCLMVIEKRSEKKIRDIKGLPESNFFINALVGGMIITGFILEGARIAMTGSPEGSQFAFIGYLISRALLDYHLNGIYAYLWYLHAVLTAAFIAYLPFCRMFHVFIAPLSLLLRGASRE